MAQRLKRGVLIFAFALATLTTACRVEVVNPPAPPSEPASTSTSNSSSKDSKTSSCDKSKCRGYAGPGGPCYDGPGGPCYSGPGGTGVGCKAECK